MTSHGLRFEAAQLMFASNVEGITIDEALDTAGGFSLHHGPYQAHGRLDGRLPVVRIRCRAASWKDIDWPRGLRERIEPSGDYLRELLTW